MRFEGQAAIVTGAGSGIGLAIATRLANDGAMVLLVDRDGTAADREAAKLAARGLKAAPCAGDVSLPSDADNFVRSCIERFGRLDILINNAGVSGTYPFMDQPVDHWNKVMAVNVTGALVCGQAAARQMLAQGRGGRIVNIASISGIVAGTGRTAYGTSKAAIIGLTRQMALELAPHDILVNAIAPGPVDTPMTKAIHTPETRTAYNARIPQGRYGTPEEIAAATAFLASSDASYINGQILAVDGGFVAAGMRADDVLERPR